MQSFAAFMVLLVLGLASGQNHQGGHQMPTTLAQCVAQENQPANATREAEMQKVEQCMANCRSSSAQSQSPQQQCWHQGGQNNGQGQQMKAQMEAAKPALLQCAQTTCSPTPIPRTPRPNKGAGGHGPHAYNASSPRDQQRCAKMALRQAFPPPTTSSGDNQAERQCMEACRPAGSGGHGAGGNRRRRNAHHGGGGHGGPGGCLGAFCTPAQMKQCAQEAGLSQPNHQDHSAQSGAKFQQICGCLKNANSASTFDCTQFPLPQATCTSLFQNAGQQHDESESEGGSEGN